MFTDFLYILRGHGMKTTFNEWNSLMDALEMNLNEASLTEFYYMARAVLVKKESDYDRFDQAFLEYFKNVKTLEELPQELLDWLAKAHEQTPYDKAEVDARFEGLSLEDIRKMMEERLKEQHEAHHGGNKWIGTGGTSAFGHSGYSPRGIRVGGPGKNRSALQVAEERNYRDFRDDSVLQIRQFQVALKKLRLLSCREDGPKTELNVEKTIEKTCDQGGRLEIIMERPRKNQTKLLILMDSGGSMWAYAELCNRLFQAVNQASHFKDLKVYYFHNCFYEYLFTTPSCSWRDKVSTEWVFNNLKEEYKVILVGDGAMAPSELLYRGGSLDYFHSNENSGLQWLERLKKRFPSSIWLNPIRKETWDYTYGAYTIGMIREIFPMFPLSAAGLEEGVKALKAGETKAEKVF